MRKGLLALALAIGLCFPAAGCGSRSISGVYVYEADHEVAALQLVGARDGSLSGSLQSARASANYQVSVDSVTLSGAIDGDTLALSTPPVLGMSTSFSGVRSGNEITLTYASGSGIGNLVFRRSNAREFTRLTDELRQRQQLRAVAHEQEQAAARQRAFDNDMRAALPQFTTNMDRLARTYNERMPRFDAAVAHLADLAQRARDAARARDQEPDGSVRQGQLSVYISQVGIETNQLGIELEQAQREFERERATVQERLTDARAWCARTRDASCTGLTAAASTYTTAADARAAAFALVATGQARAEADIEALN